MAKNNGSTDSPLVIEQNGTGYINCLCVEMAALDSLCYVDQMRSLFSVIGKLHKNERSETPDLAEIGCRIAETTSRRLEKLRESTESPVSEGGAST